LPLISYRNLKKLPENKESGDQASSYHESPRFLDPHYEFSAEVMSFTELEAPIAPDGIKNLDYSHRSDELENYMTAVPEMGYSSLQNQKQLSFKGDFNSQQAISEEFDICKSIHSEEINPFAAGVVDAKVHGKVNLELPVFGDLKKRPVSRKDSGSGQKVESIYNTDSLCNNTSESLMSDGGVITGGGPHGDAGGKRGSLTGPNNQSK
jgi:hypothetical protein